MSEAGAARWIVAHRSWREAHGRVLAAVRAGRGIVLPSGPEGVGKSLPMEGLARALREAGFDAFEAAQRCARRSARCETAAPMRPGPGPS